MPLFRIARRRCLSRDGYTLSPRLLTAHEAVLLAAIAEQVIPLADEPGSSQARAVHFVDEQLGGPLARLLPAYRQGLAAFEAACRAETSQSFLDLSPEQRQAFLLRVECGHKLSAFYQMVRAHAEASLRVPREAEAAPSLHFQQAFVQTKHAI